MLRKQGEEIKHCTCFHGEEHWLKEAGDLSIFSLTVWKQKQNKEMDGVNSDQPKIL